MSRVLLFLCLILSAAPAAAFDVRTGKLTHESDAALSCPRACQNYGGWDKRWKKLPGGKGYCGCANRPLGKKDEANGGPLVTEAQAAWACVRACESYGGWDKVSRAVEDQLVCRCKQTLVSDDQ